MDRADEGTKLVLRISANHAPTDNDLHLAIEWVLSLERGELAMLARRIRKTRSRDAHGRRACTRRGNSPA